MSDAPVKQACWFRLLKAIEDKYDPDYIFIDLNPAPSKFNCLAMLRWPHRAAGLHGLVHVIDLSGCSTLFDTNWALPATRMPCHLPPCPTTFHARSCDFIIASVGAALYDISSCAFFLKEVIAKMYQYGQVNVSRSGSRRAGNLLNTLAAGSGPPARPHTCLPA